MDSKLRRSSHLALVLALSWSSLACTEQQALASGAERETGDGSPPVAHADEAMDIDEQVAFARQALAERLQIDPAGIRVETARTVNWRSGAAGCPKPGMDYTMAIVPGVLILLEADGAIHHYHAGRGRTPFFCPPDRVEAPAYGLGEEAM